MNKLRKKVYAFIYPPIENMFRKIEKVELSRAANLMDIPPRSLRGGGLGTTSYGEWCYSIGFFEALIGMNVLERPASFLDVGCGVGRLYLASKPFLTPADDFVGIDISKEFIRICKEQYQSERLNFIHIPSGNAYYAKEQAGKNVWPIESGSKTLVTALSVWTHLNEDDWTYYLGEVSRVLKPGGRAIISFFILDHLYEPSRKTSKISAFYPQPEDKWVFDKQAYGSKDWFYPSWASVPEVAIGVTKFAFDSRLAELGLKQISSFPGQWKDQPGLFFQDLAILEKA